MLINPTLGFYENEGLLYYLHNGSPIFCHKKEDITTYRYICGNLVFNKLCTTVDLAKAPELKGVILNIMLRLYERMEQDINLRKRTDGVSVTQ